MCFSRPYSAAGTIEIGAFFEYFEWPRNAFANHLFSFMESADEDNRVDFGDFVKVSPGCVPRGPGIGVYTPA